MLCTTTTPTALWYRQCPILCKEQLPQLAGTDNIQTCTSCFSLGEGKHLRLRIMSAMTQMLQLLCWSLSCPNNNKHLPFLQTTSITATLCTGGMSMVSMYQHTYTVNTMTLLSFYVSHTHTLIHVSVFGLYTQPYTNICGLMSTYVIHISIKSTHAHILVALCVLISFCVIHTYIIMCL